MARKFTEAQKVKRMVRTSKLDHNQKQSVALDILIRSSFKLGMTQKEVVDMVRRNVISLYGIFNEAPERVRA